MTSRLAGGEDAGGGRAWSSMSSPSLKPYDKTVKSSSVIAPPRKQIRCLAGSSSVAIATRPFRELALTEVQRVRRRSEEKRKLQSMKAAVASKPLELAPWPKTSVSGLDGGGLPGPPLRHRGTRSESVSPVSTTSTCSVMTTAPRAPPGGGRPHSWVALLRAAMPVAPSVADEPRAISRFAEDLDSSEIILSIRSSGTRHQSLGLSSSG
mmetsp:Transcript_3736/g.11424  ORF Transcript_3736/g.11424 Transcript_3736/m.11424 type:complete len:209 (-) Transcript_3736:239-865(-)